MIIQFPHAHKNAGNGAREVLRQYFEHEFEPYLEAFGAGDTELPPADYLLTWLWTVGFQVVPLQ